MTLAAIKIAALKLMFTSYTNLVEANMTDYYNETNLNSYLYAMEGSIDRCIDRIKTERLQPTKTLVLTDLGTEGDYYTVYDLTSIASDIYAVDRIIFEDEYGNYNASVAYKIENDNLIVKNTTLEGEFRLIYYTEITSVALLDDTDTVALKDDVARVIPYFIKGELYQEDEPNLASEARNIFEQTLRGLKTKSFSRQTHTKRVFTP